MGQWSTATKVAVGNTIIGQIDADASAAKLKFYDSGATLLGTLTLNDPSFNNTDGVLVLQNLPLSAASVASGTIDNYELTDGADTVVRSGGVGTSGSSKNVIVANTNITAPQNIQLDTCSINALPDDAG